MKSTTSRSRPVIPTRWNLTYDMIIVAWEKRKVLNAMTTTCQKGGKAIF